MLAGPEHAAVAPPRARPQLTLARFRLLEAMLRADGYGEMIAWSEGLQPPRDCRAFAKECVYVIYNSGMRVGIATAIYWKCLRALARGQSAASVFGHPGKAAAIDHIWTNRRILFEAYRIAREQAGLLPDAAVRRAGTRHHLAKNLGLNTVKPDVHLARLARAEREAPWELCARFAAPTGYREATIDTILWRACADGYLDSAAFVTGRWDEALNQLELERHRLRTQPFSDGSSQADQIVIDKPKES